MNIPYRADGRNQFSGANSPEIFTWNDGHHVIKEAQLGLEIASCWVDLLGGYNTTIDEKNNRPLGHIYNRSELCIMRLSWQGAAGRGCGL